MIYSVENIVNLIILVMLLVMIIYCIILNRRLKAFRNIKQEMADIISQLNTSTSHAQKSIVEFKNVVFEQEKKLSKKLREASEMADELDMINKTGSNLADRIEQGLVTGRKTQSDLPVQNEPQSDKISLSDLEQSENGDKETDKMRENLRNVR